MSAQQIVGLIMVGTVLLAVFGAVIHALGWKEGLLALLVSVIASVMVAIGCHLIEG